MTRRLSLAVSLLSLSCLTGCWEEINYEPSPSRVRTKVVASADDTPPLEPSGVSRRVDPPEESTTFPLDLPPKQTPPESQPIESAPAQPEPVEPEPQEIEVVEPEVSQPEIAERETLEPETVEPEVIEPATVPVVQPLEEPAPEENPTADAGRLGEDEVDTEDLPVDEPAPEPPTEVVEESSPVAEVTAEPDTQSSESVEAEMEPQGEEDVDESDDPFALFDSDEPETVEEKTEEESKSEEVARTVASEQSQPNTKTDLPVEEEIELLFGDKSATAQPTESEPAPPLQISTTEELNLEKAATREDTPPEVSEEPNEDSAEVASDNEAQEPPNTEAPAVQAAPAQPAEDLPPVETDELPETPPEANNDISILVEPKPATDRADVWRTASRWSMALALRAKGMKPKTYGSAWKVAQRSAEDLSVELPAMPEVERESDAVSTIQSSMIESTGPELWQAIEAKHGVSAGDLAELAVRTHRMLLNYSPKKPHFANEAAELTRLAESAELPSKLWQPLMTLLEEKGSFSEVKRAIFTLHKEVAKHYQ